MLSLILLSQEKQDKIQMKLRTMKNSNETENSQIKKQMKDKQKSHTNNHGICFMLTTCSRHGVSREYSTQGNSLAEIWFLLCWQISTANSFMFKAGPCVYFCLSMLWCLWSWASAATMCAATAAINSSYVNYSSMTFLLCIIIWWKMQIN